MAILLYCIAKSDAPIIHPPTGVAGDVVVRVELGNLAAFTSSNPDRSNWLRLPLQTSALEFHRVLSEVFKSSAIIPLRFPTVFDNEEQLTQRLQERANEYAALLDKFRDLVQMDIRVSNPALKKPTESGTQYLKLRQIMNATIDKVTAELRSVLSGLSQDWRYRPSKDGARAFALICRNQVADFRNMMRNAPVPSDISVRVSGPWPVSEFIEPSSCARIDSEHGSSARESAAAAIATRLHSRKY